MLLISIKLRREKKHLCLKRNQTLRISQMRNQEQEKELKIRKKKLRLKRQLKLYKLTRSQSIRRKREATIIKKEKYGKRRIILSLKKLQMKLKQMRTINQILYKRRKKCQSKKVHRSKVQRNHQRKKLSRRKKRMMMEKMSC